MSDEELMQAMNESVKEHTPEVVLAEYPVTSTELHKIANGDCCIFNNDTNPFSIRFLLQSSFKSPKSDFVINKYVMQIMVTQKQKFMRKEEIATRTRVVKTKRAEKVKVERIETQVKESKKKLF